MGWVNLGGLTPRTDWQYFPIEAIAGEVFRAHHAWQYRPIGRCWIAQAFGTANEIYGVRRVYPSLEANLYQLLIPEAFQIEGIVTRKIAVKSAYYYPQINWQIQIEMFVPD